MVTQNDIFIMSVFRKEASGNRPEADESKLFRFNLYKHSEDEEE